MRQLSVGVVGYDFTVKGSSSSYTNNRKMAHVKDTAAKRGFPVVFLGESTVIGFPYAPEIAFPRQVEVQLQQQNPDLKFEDDRESPLRLAGETVLEV